MADSRAVVGKVKDKPNIMLGACQNNAGIPWAQFETMWASKNNDIKN